MSSLTRPRGPLPARIYWFRRVLVLGTALALVLGIGNLLRLGSDGKGSADPEAVQVAAGASDSTQADPTSTSTGKQRRGSHKPTKVPLPQPDGPCEPGDIVMTPIVKDAVAGSPVKIRLKLSTRVSPACTWRLSSDSLTFKITRSTETVWSSLDCPRMVDARDLVLRQIKPTWTSIYWNARSSQPSCGTMAEWALRGWYHVSVAAFDGEPTDSAFRMTLPVQETITASPSGSATKKPSSGASDTSSDKPSGKATKKPSRKPSGAVEPSSGG
ncbi:MAG: hypothetical protein U0R80_14940 [Nocardioidaceae bacterium]